MTGTVRDATGAVVPGAEVAISNVETGLEQQAASNNAGVYRFINLQPGMYTLSCASSEFQTAVVNPFKLVVNRTATFDFVLEVGAVTETVTVQAAGAQLQASSAELGSAVTEKQVVDLPLNGRNFTTLLELTPGVAPVKRLSEQRWIHRPSDRGVPVFGGERPDEPLEPIHAGRRFQPRCVR